MTKREYSPWIDHDGKGYPYEICNDHVGRGFTQIESFTDDKRLRTQTPKQQATNRMDPEHPGWTWKRSGWFGRGDWVASDPAYARIIRYRFSRDAQEQSQQVEMLRDIAQGKREPEEV